MLIPLRYKMDMSPQVFGLLVWTLIGGTEYFRVSAFGWVMFVAVFYWVLTVFFLIIYLTMAYTRIPQVPWTTVVSALCSMHHHSDTTCLLRYQHYFIIFLYHGEKVIATA